MLVSIHSHLGSVAPIQLRSLDLVSHAPRVPSTTCAEAVVEEEDQAVDELRSEVHPRKKRNDELQRWRARRDLHVLA